MKTVKLTEVTCENSPKILHYEGHLDLIEIKEKLSYEGFLKSDIDEDDDDSDIDFQYYTVDENEIQNDILDENGNIFHSSSLLILEIGGQIGYELAYEFAKYTLKKHREKFKLMKKELGLTNESIARIIELTPDSVKTMTQPNSYLPSWADAMIYVWEKLK